MKSLRFAFGFCLLSVVAAIRAEPVPAMPAPAWTLKDVEGKPVSSEKFKGKVVVLDFWATWCGPCRGEIPGYVELQKKYGKDGLVVIGVSVDDGPAVVKQFVQKYGVSYQVVMADESLPSEFDFSAGIPTTFIIDRSGKIRDRKLGAEPTAEFEKRVVALLK